MAASRASEAGEEKMKLGKVENWETVIRIDQDRGGKDEIGGSRKLVR